MIIDHLSNAGFYFGADPLLREALEFLRLPEIATLGMGRHSLRGDDLFALVSGGVTVAEGNAPWEAHRRYVDLHHVVEGGEWMGYAPLHRMRQTRSYDEGEDCALYRGEGNFLRVFSGMFVVFNVTDVHKPDIHLGEPEAFRKIVVKIRRREP